MADHYFHMLIMYLHLLRYETKLTKINVNCNSNCCFPLCLGALHERVQIQRKAPCKQLQRVRIDGTSWDVHWTEQDGQNKKRKSSNNCHDGDTFLA